jgi:hypothetical protein
VDINLNVNLKLSNKLQQFAGRILFNQGVIMSGLADLDSKISGVEAAVVAETAQLKEGFASLEASKGEALAAIEVLKVQVADLKAQIEAGVPVNFAAQVAKLDAVAAAIEAISDGVGIIPTGANVEIDGVVTAAADVLEAATTSLPADEDTLLGTNIPESDLIAESELESI